MAPGRCGQGRTGARLRRWRARRTRPSARGEGWRWPPSGEQVVPCRGSAVVDREVEVLVAPAALEHLVEQLAILPLGAMALEGLLLPLEVLADVHDVGRRHRRDRPARVERRRVEEEPGGRVRGAALGVKLALRRAKERADREERGGAVIVVLAARALGSE